MKILLITEFFPSGKELRFSGGVEARTFFIAKLLSRNNQVSVVASKGLRDPSIETMFGFTVYRVGPKRDYTASAGHLFSRILYVKDAIKFAKNQQADIVDGGNYISHFIAKQIAEHQRIPVVAWYPDVWVSNWIKNAGLYGIFGEVLERLNLLRGFDSYIAISRNTAKKLNKYAKKNVHIVYCGIDEKEFRIKSNKFKEPTIICISRLTKYKNIDTLILAFAHLSTKMKTAKLIIVGTGSQKNKMIKMIRELKLLKKISILENLPRKNLINLYKSSHVFSLPSFVEGFGIATIEAAAAALPYVISDTPIHKEVTKNGYGGFLVDPRKPLNFANKFYKLLTDQQLYQQKSKQAKKLSNNYSWQEIALKTEEMYKSLVKKEKCSLQVDQYTNLYKRL